MRHRKTKKKMKGDITMLEAGTGDSPNPLSDDDDEFQSPVCSYIIYK
jgi:hypothetical protein